MTHSRPAKAIIASVLVLGSSFANIGATCAQPANSYLTMAPIEQYREKNRADEIALARSAAPSSISLDAEVLVLGSRGYETAVKGKNGFVCFVERSWAAGFDDAEFWNPKLRAPNCFNAAAARTELPQYLKRTEWVLAGASKQQMIERTRSAVADHSFRSPEPGAFSFMLSKNGYLSDEAAYRKQICDGLRAKIEAAPIDAGLLHAAWAKVEEDLAGGGVFVRSSTNVEDLEGFNGAGLYDTVANVKGKEELGAAIKHVWASLWKVTASRSARCSASTTTGPTRRCSSRWA